MLVDLSTKRGYAVASAVRGPDVAHEVATLDLNLKGLFTAPLRAELGISDEYCQSTWDTWLNAEKLSSAIQYLKADYSHIFKFSHYLIHIDMAWVALAEEVADGPKYRLYHAIATFARILERYVSFDEYVRYMKEALRAAGIEEVEA